MRKTKCLFDETKQTPEGMVSVSQLMARMSCAKKWAYGYLEELTPRVERPYLTIGKLCHKGMQVAMENVWKDQQAGLCTDYESGLWDAWRSAGTSAMVEDWEQFMESTPFLGEEIPDQAKVLEDALSVFSQAFMEFEPWKYEVLSVCTSGVGSHPILAPALELHFVVPCSGSKGLHGYIDSILKDTTTGFVWCTDYKFRKQLEEDAEEAFNIQNAVYSWACHKMGIKITGTQTWQHCNTPAATPSLNKNGTVSRAKIKTTWEKYAQFCTDHGVDPKPYQEEMQEKLADIEWFRATFEYRNLDTVKKIWSEVVVPATHLVKSSYKKANKRSLFPWNCKTCQFRDLCQAELRGYDAVSIRLRDYTKKHHGNKGVDNTPPTVV